METYISNVKDDFTKLMGSYNHETSNLSPEERIALGNLSNRKDIIIQSADKGGKVVILDTENYKRECQKQLNDSNFYQELTHRGGKSSVWGEIAREERD